MVIIGVNFVKSWHNQSLIKFFAKIKKGLIAMVILFALIGASLYLAKFGGIFDVIYRFFITSVYAFGEP